MTVLKIFPHSIRSSSSPEEAAASLPLTGFLLAVAVCLLAAGGCDSPSYRVRYEVSVTPSVVEREPPEEGPRTSEIAADIAWTVTSSRLEARVTNNADTTAAILWEGATISFDGGEAEQLLHGSPAAGPDLPQDPTEIPGGGQVVLDAVPASAAEWEWLPNRVMGGSWSAVRDIMGTELPDSGSEDAMMDAAREAVGRRLTVRIPLRIGHRILRQTYDMRVVDVRTFRAYH